MHGAAHNILFCGDPHGRFDHIFDAAYSNNPDAIVLLGDIGAPAPLSVLMQPVLERDIEVLWIPGNHDTEDPQEYDFLFNEEGHPNLHCIHGRVHTVQGKQGRAVRVAGLGGVFRGKAWWPKSKDGRGVPPEEGVSAEKYLSTLGKGNRWRGGLPLRHRSTIFSDQWLAMSKLTTDILVTHEAPGFHQNGFDVLHELAVKMGAVRSFHGHHHRTYDYGTHDSVHAFGVGICAVLDINGQVIVKEARKEHAVSA